MDEQLDNDLRNRIREVFLNFEDNTADEGWLQLRKKFPERQATRRTLAWIWRGSAAAILLLFLSIGLLIFKAPVEIKKFSNNKFKHTQSENLTIAKKPSVGPDKIKLITKKDRVESKGAKGFAKHPVSLKINGKQPMLQQPQFITSSKLPIAPIPGITNVIAKTNDSVKNKINNTVDPLMAATAVITSPPSNKLPNPAKEPAKPITDMFTDNPVQKDQKSNEKVKRVTLGLYAATYFNYAKGSDNQVNIGAGITSDIRLSKNLKLVTGISIAQNTLNYAGVNPPAAANNNFALPMALLSSSVQAVPTFKNYNASLVGLDIPINLKYEFNPKKSDTYISAGLSSGTFINESYTYKYNYPAFFTQSLQQTQGESTHNNFNGFYFARTLNVAFGIGYPFGKSNRLIIEPFLKYPLNGLGSQNIRFGAGGLNLKLNFKPRK